MTARMMMVVGLLWFALVLEWRELMVRYRHQGRHRRPDGVAWSPVLAAHTGHHHTLAEAAR